MLIFADCTVLGLMCCDVGDFFDFGLVLVLIFADCNDSGLILVVIVVIPVISC